MPSYTPPHLIDGMGLGAWLRLLVRERGRVGLAHVPSALWTTLLAPANTAFGAVQTALYARRLSAVKISPPPVFIVGHWRTGTTLLHELLALHPDHTAPRNHQCFVPNQSLLAPWLSRAISSITLSDTRAMDNMAMRPNGPQEEEFALCSLGLRSPYLWISFPRGRYDQAMESLAEVSSAERLRWERIYVQFLKGVLLRAPGRLIVKNPLNSMRIEILERLFPDALYINMMRHPAAVYCSTLRLWRALHDEFGYQRPPREGLEEHVLQTGERVHKALQRARRSVSPERWCEVRFEDLVADPQSELRRIYSTLRLAPFEASEPAVDRYLARRASYRPQTAVSPDDVQRVESRWSAHFSEGRYRRSTDALPSQLDETATKGALGAAGNGGGEDARRNTGS